MCRYKFITVVALVVLVNLCEAAGKKKIFIADRKVPCAGRAECLQIKAKMKDSMQSFTGVLTGLDYEEGYQYNVLVETPGKEKFSTTGNYKVLKVISKTKTDFNPASRLAGKKWILAQLDDTHNTLGLTDSSIFVKFDIKNNRISGQTTCNGFSGSIVKADGANIKFDNISASKMLCEGGNKMTFETIILKFIRQTTTYKLAGNMVTLMSPNGENLILTAE